VSLVLIGVLALSLAGESPANNRAQQRAQASSLLNSAHEFSAAGEHDSALAVLGKIREIDPNNQDAFYFTAVAHLALADTARAISMLTEGAEKAPLSSRIKLLLVRLRIRGGEYEEADKLLVSVFRFKPKNPEALYLSGLLSIARGDTTKALEAWEQALERVHTKGIRR
jgi:tetratricopeptide (TPR) repeat protein